MDNNFQLISLEQLETISFGDKDFKKELIGIFLEQVPEFIGNMKKFLAEKNYPEFAKEAHTAKSSVLIFGLDDTGNSLKQMQLQAEDNVTDQLQGLLDKVEHEMNGAASELGVILNNL